MKPRLFVLLCLVLPFLSSRAQETKHELGISLFGYNENFPDYGGVPDIYYLAILNNVVYRYKLAEKVKLRGVLNEELLNHFTFEMDREALRSLFSIE